MTDLFLSVDFLRLALPLTGAVVAWFVDEWRKRLLEQNTRKEACCRELIHAPRGFYAGAERAAELRTEFLDQLNQRRLYCPDTVILKRYSFLTTVDSDKIQSDQVKERAMGNFVAAIREDLLFRKLVRKTALKGTEFRRLNV